MSILIDIDHEAGDLSEYTTTVVDSGDLSVTSGAALAGSSYGMALVIDDTTSIYGQLTLGANVTTGIMRARFYFDPNSLSIGTGTYIRIFSVYNSANTLIFNVRYYGSHRLRLNWTHDGGTGIGDYVTVSDAPHYVEVEFTRAATNVSGDGVAKLWVDGTLSYTSANMDNYDTFNNWNRIQLGASNISGTAPSGTYYLDELVVRDDSTTIGPVSSAHNLTITDNTHNHTVDAPTITQKYPLPVTDLFTGTNGTDLNVYRPAWTVTGGDLEIYNNGVRSTPVAAGARSRAYWNASDFSDNQYAEATFSFVTTPSSGQIGVVVRSSPSQASYYAFYSDRDGNTYVFKNVNTTITVLSGAIYSVGTSGTLRLEINGSVLSAYINGSLYYRTTDTSLTTGYPGITAYQATADSILTAWEGGNADIDLVISDTSHNHTGAALALQQAQDTAITDNTHNHTADTIALTQTRNVTAESTTHNHTADPAALSYTLPVYDPFTSTGQALEAYRSTWTKTFGRFETDTNALVPAYDGGPIIMLAYWNASTFSDDQYAEGNFTLDDYGGMYRIGLAVRVHASNQTAYILYSDAAYTNVIKIVGGSATSLSGNLGPIGTSASLRLDVEGTTLRAYINGQLAWTGTDSAISSGKAGVSAYGGEADTLRMLDWGAGDIATVPLTSSDTAHDHTADTLALTQAHDTVATDNTHTHTSDTLALTQAQDVVVDEAAHTHTAAAPALTQAQDSVIASAAHTHTAGTALLTQLHQLLIDAATHNHTVDGVELVQSGSGDLTIDGTTHNHTTDTLTLDQGQVLVAASATHNHTADSVVLSGSTHILTISDATHNHTAGNVYLLNGEGELPPGQSDGASAVSGTILAARFLAATLDIVSSTEADALLSTGNLLGAAEGVSLVEGTITPAPGLAGGSDGAAGTQAGLERLRELSASFSPTVGVTGTLSARLGLRSLVDAGAGTQANVGLDMPFAGASDGSSTPAGHLAKGGQLLQDIYLEVTGTPVFNNDADIVTGSPGTWTVPVTLRRGGEDGTQLPQGAAVVKWGEYSATPTTDFTGGIVLTSDLDNAPYVDVFTVAKNDSDTIMPWDDAAVKPRVRMGNLKGVLGNAADKWGIAMSTDLSDTAAPFIEASNEGLLISNADLTIIDGDFYVGDEAESTFLKWDGTTLTIGGDGSGVTNIDGGNIQTGTITADKLTILDGGEIRFGNLDKDAVDLSTFTGLRMYKDDLLGVYELAGYTTGEKQAYFGSDGRLYAGGDNIQIHGDGIDFHAGTVPGDTKRSMHFVDNTETRYATIEGLIDLVNGERHLDLYADGLADQGQINILSQGDGGSYVTLWSMANNDTDSYAYIDVAALGGNNTSIDLASRILYARGQIYTENGIWLEDKGGNFSALLELDGRGTPAYAPDAGDGYLWWSSSKNFPMATNGAGVQFPLGMGEYIIPLHSFYQSATSFVTNGNIMVIRFPDAVCFIGTGFICPKGWGGHTLYADIVWYADDVAGTVGWQMDVHTQTPGAAPVPSTPTGAQSQSIDPSGTNVMTTTFNLGSTALVEGSGLYFRLVRAGGGLDSHTGNAHLVAIKVYIA